MSKSSALLAKFRSQRGQPPAPQPHPPPAPAPSPHPPAASEAPASEASAPPPPASFLSYSSTSLQRHSANGSSSPGSSAPPFYSPSPPLPSFFPSLAHVSVNHNNNVLSLCSLGSSSVSLVHSSGQVLETVEVNLGPVAQACFGGKSRYLLSGGAATTAAQLPPDGGFLSVWDLKKKASVRTFALPAPPLAVSFDPTDTLVASLLPTGASHLFSLAASTPLPPLLPPPAAGPPACFSFSPLRPTRLTSAHGGLVPTHDIHRQPPLSTLSPPHARVAALALSPVNKLLLAVAGTSGGGGG
ncbi:hypothetical protein TeGR_g3704, partial [Tetraparma gracilis]